MTVQDSTPQPDEPKRSGDALGEIALSVLLVTGWDRVSTERPLTQPALALTAVPALKELVSRTRST